MNKQEFLNILKKYTKHELPTISVEGLFDTYREELEKEIRKELDDEANALKRSIKAKLKYYLIRIRAKINAKLSELLKDVLVYILRENHEVRKQVKDTVQLHDIEVMLKKLDEVTDELYNMYQHELDTAVKKQLLDKWVSVTRLLLRKKLRK